MIRKYKRSTFLSKKAPFSIIISSVFPVIGKKRHETEDEQEYNSERKKSINQTIEKTKHYTTQGSIKEK